MDQQLSKGTDLVLPGRRSFEGEILSFAFEEVIKGSCKRFEAHSASQFSIQALTEPLIVQLSLLNNFV